MSKPEYTGGSVSYYTVHVAKPTKPDRVPYDAECNDIIEALGMNYAEGNAFKAIWRMCAARQGKVKQGYKDGRYDAEKVEFFGARLVAQHSHAPTVEKSASACRHAYIQDGVQNDTWLCMYCGEQDVGR